MKKFILASASPRRKKLLEQIGIDFKVTVSDVDESKIKEKDCRTLVKKLSYLKAKNVSKKTTGVIIAADTIVNLNGRILGKPKNYDEAYQMLSDLSGNKHQVVTGITIIDGDNVLTDYKETTITFRELEEKEIEAYIATGSPMDKAGGYGIQDQGAIFVEEINGCFYNVMGLSLVKLVEMLKKLGVKVSLS
ncbi:Maf family protein [Orenia marismortui]|uniref:dTTP/UTP pyrophosphatase n=1 Tax=Orenia marismortui TaxID=46469 RepID=A0A4R8H2Y6_9FIRM|nr:Maf family protein [Orenia marismortui]TDX49016.1 septum formation protein [Orenia marismortui]